MDYEKKEGLNTLSLAVPHALAELEQLYFEQLRVQWAVFRLTTLDPMIEPCIAPALSTSLARRFRRPRS